MRILLKGYYGFGNFGDDILLIVSYKLVKARFPTAQIFVYSNFTENLNNYQQVKNYNKYLLGLTSPDIIIIDWTYKGEFDFVFNGGGGIYFDNQKGNVFYQVINPLIIKLFGVSQLHLIESWIRKISGKVSHIRFKKRIGVGIGIGNFAPGSLTFLKKMAELGSYSFLWVRDEFSLTKLRHYGFKESCGKFTDLAFLSEYWKPPCVNKERVGVCTVGVVIMGVTENQQKFSKQMKSFGDLVNAKGLQVTYFCFDENHDQSLIDSLSGHEVAVWRPNTLTTSSYLHKINECDVIVSARAHGAILGAILGAIPICLASSVKLEEVAKMFPRSGFIFGMDVSGVQLLSKVEEISHNYRHYRIALGEDVNMNTTIVQRGLQLLQEHWNGQ